MNVRKFAYTTVCFQILESEYYLYTDDRDAVDVS